MVINPRKKVTAMTVVTRDDTRITRDLWSAIANGAPGATVDALGHSLPSTGYFVGGRSYVATIPVASITPDDVAGYVSDHSRTRYFGMWEHDGKIFLDAVDHIVDRDHARQLGRLRREIEIFNIATGECEEP
jgi:hypothetical protein